MAWPYTQPDSQNVVRRFLEARRLVWLSGGQMDRVLRSRTDAGFGGHPYPDCLRSYKLRRMLGCLLDRRDEGPFTVSQLSQKTGCSEERVHHNLGVLKFEGLVECKGGAWSLVQEVTVPSFGYTLEWYVAEILENQLQWTGVHAVNLKGTGFNDFDVIAVSGADFVVVECKMTEPSDPAEIRAFGARRDFVRPDLALLLVDIDRSVADLASRVGHILHDDAKLLVRVNDSSSGELWWGAKNLYVGNTAWRDNGLYRALDCCIHHYYKAVHRNAFTGSAFTSGSA